MKRALLLLLLFPTGLRAQYYDWGADPPARWREYKGSDMRVVAPEKAEKPARKLLQYVEAVRPHIAHGYHYPPLKNIPFVLHPQNEQSNGLVMWMPRRVEILSAPAPDSYAMPWLKQLAAHEYRHAVQYNTLNRGWIRVASRVLGQQGSTAGILWMYFWMLEGDAVMAETEMSTFGRGLQPRFSIEYRALGRELLRRKNVDKWFSGSYREFVPDHYQLGYPMVRYATARYGDDIWARTLRYAVRNAYMLSFSTGVGLRKLYHTHERKLFYDTFDALNDFWDEREAPEDSGRTVTELPAKDYTTYKWPLQTENGIVAFKSDFTRGDRIVFIDGGTERLLTKTGSISTRIAVGGGKIYWSEYRRSRLFPEKVTSKIVEYGKRKRTLHNGLYPTPTPDGLAWVEYAADGTYTIQPRGLKTDKEIHGLACDRGTLYALITDDEGMWIGEVQEDSLKPVTQPAYITLSDLRAGNGSLYFGSIASGRDEAHRIDLKSKQQYRLSTSAYGSFSPSPTGLTTTYSRRGYRITRQTAKQEVYPGQTPAEILLPPAPRWNEINLDTLSSKPTPPSRRYRRGTHLLHVHSWFPVSIDPYAALEEFDLLPQLGATVLSQNLLSTTSAFASWGWSRADGHVLKAALRNSSLGVRLEAGGTWGGAQQIYAIEGQSLPSRKKYASVYGQATLPLIFDAGAHVRQLSLMGGYNFSNGRVGDFSSLTYTDGKIDNIGAIGYKKGLHKLSLGASFSDQTRAAYRDVAAPWGYAVAAFYDLNPTNAAFSPLVSAYGRFQTPGLWRHHSFMLAGAYQTSVGGYKLPNGIRPLTYRSARILPRGFTTADIRNNRYAAVEADYHFPLCYPEGGWPGIVYVKRIRLNLGGQYARYDPSRELWSAGCDILLDCNFLRSPAANTWTLKFSLYRPSKGGLWFGFGLQTPLNF